MSDQKKTTQDTEKSRVTANQPGEQRGSDKQHEGQAHTAAKLPGSPQGNDQGKPKGNADDRSAKSDPNPGPGVSSQGHRVDEDTPAPGHERDTQGRQPGANKDMPSKEQPRDQDKDRKEPQDEQHKGEHDPKHGTKAKAL
jgi:hypothetical protein